MTEPIKVEITLDLDHHLARFRGLDTEGDPIEGPTTLEDVVIGEAGRQIVERVLHQAVKEDARFLRERVRTITDEEIKARVRPLLEEALTAAVQPTNGFGEPKGDPVTLRQIIVKTAEDWLRKPSGGGLRGEAKTPVQAFIHEAVASAFTSELKKALDQARAEVVAAVQEKGAEVLAQTIRSMAGSR